jgi:hypothetical protein
MNRRTSWIWAAGCAAWLFYGAVCMRYPNKQKAELGFLLAILYGIAWLFFRTPPQRR